MLWNALLGFRADGRPIYRFCGGAPDDDGGGDGGGGDDGGDDDGGGDTPETDLPDGVKKVLANERAATKKVRDEFRPYKAALRAAGIHSPDDLAKVLGGGGDSKGTPAPTVDADKIRREAQAEADRKAFRLVAESKIEARATGKFADPEDAVNALRADIDDFYDKDGKPDVKAIDRELSGLLERKPHYGATRKAPDFDGGARQTAVTSSDWNAQLREESARKRGRR